MVQVRILQRIDKTCFVSHPGAQTIFNYTTSSHPRRDERIRVPDQTLFVILPWYGFKIDGGHPYWFDAFCRWHLHGARYSDDDASIGDLQA